MYFIKTPQTQMKSEEYKFPNILSLHSPYSFRNISSQTEITSSGPHCQGITIKEWILIDQQMIPLATYNNPKTSFIQFYIYIV